MDKQTIKSIRKDIDKELETVAEKYGIHLELGNIRYDDNSFKAKLNGVEVNGDPTDKDAKFKAEFAKHAQRFGFAPSDFNKEFKRGDKVFQIKSFKPRAHKYPVLAEEKNTGKMYKFATQMVNLQK